MKKFREFRDKLTAKQAWGISLIISFVIALVSVFIFSFTEDNIIYLLFLGIFVCTISLIPMVFIFDLGYKGKQKQWEAEKNTSIPTYSLSEDKRLMCFVGELGKIIINKCLERNIFVNTQKLEKLLVLMQILHMTRVKKALFPQDILVHDSCGVVIKEIDWEFMQYAIECNEKQTEYIALLDEQEETIEYVLKEYGNMDAWDINELPLIQELISKSISVNDKKVIPANIMLGFYI